MTKIFKQPILHYHFGNILTSRESKRIIEEEKLLISHMLCLAMELYREEYKQLLVKDYKLFKSFSESKLEGLNKEEKEYIKRKTILHYYSVDEGIKTKSLQPLVNKFGLELIGNHFADKNFEHDINNLLMIEYKKIANYLPKFSLAFSDFVELIFSEQFMRVTWNGIKNNSFDQEVVVSYRKHNDTFLAYASRFLKVVNNYYSVYKKASNEVKNQLLKLVVSNWVNDGSKHTIELKKPYSFLSRTGGHPVWQG